MKLLHTTFNQNRTGTGTKEWADQSYNICHGCENSCHYCYAKGMAHRFGRTKGSAWSTMVVDDCKVAGADRKFSGVVMFPTTHDITPSIMPACLQTLHNLLGNGNQVLIVSKPHYQVVKTLCRELEPYRKHLQFRFTIGSLSKATTKLWEPGAPLPHERIKALKHAYRLKFSTSVSMEPMLGKNAEMIQLVTSVSPFVTDTIWLGKLNGGVSTKGLPTQIAAELEVAKRNLRLAQSDENILALVAALEKHPKVRWKDSIKKIIGAAQSSASIKH